MALRRPCCCKPPCTCLIAKDSFRGIVNAISVSGPSISIHDRCLAGNYLTGSLSASTTINYDDGFCGESTGAGLCPAIQSHYFGPLNITVGDVTPVSKITWLAGRNGNCLIGANACQILESGIDAPAPCISGNEYGQLPAYYQHIASAGVGVGYFCLGGNTGEPNYSLYVTAQYTISESHQLFSGPGWDSSLDGFPLAPTGWSRAQFGSSRVYTRNDNKATLTMASDFRWYTFKVCNGVTVTYSPGEIHWRLTAYTVGDPGDTTVALDYPFDPAGIFAGITGTIT